MYEVTVKPFDLARIRDSFDSILQYNEINQTDLNEIIVICREQDCPTDMKESTLSFYMGNYTYKNIIYYFLDIYEWIADKLIQMTPFGRVNFYKELNSYISDINTAERVKLLWLELHNEE